MALGVLRLHLYIPGCTSLKEKRRRLKPFLVRLHREFNISASEMEHQDSWQETIVGCALLGNDSRYVQRSLEQITNWIESNWPDMELVNDRIELF